MQVTCSKFEAASRQLDEAIGLLLADHDPLAVRTLAAAAFGLFADLVEHSRPDKSWRSRLIQDSGLDKKQALAVIHNAQNFLKHADRDPHSQLSFDESENEELIFIATLDCGELGGPLTTAMQAFQIWYLALNPGKLGADHDLTLRASSAFQDLPTKTREEQFAAGLDFLRLMLEKYGRGSYKPRSN
ncbi:hypothetical protein [Pseudomonas urmiensis]|uniref:Uncharacterized protein n=1 Tax=Pseudomonas urmiensis TaxID=2745493 RepID=A0A923FXV5_9PSED|nr:hypothetical protein [Pseudomonas urmiensis]MBV4536850.1 hypothetical protein [Pseudomonas urmiensis]